MSNEEYKATKDRLKKLIKSVDELEAGDRESVFDWLVSSISELEEESGLVAL